MTLNPDQLKMFMTADEIREHYEPLKGDRHSLNRAEYGQPGATSVPPVSRKPPRGSEGRWDMERPTVYAGRTARHDPETGEVAEDVPYTSAYFHETSDALYARKAQTGFRTKKHAALAADVTSGANIESPIWLGTGGDTGVEGKPMVYGGHHRIGMMSVAGRGDDLMPVIHNSDFNEVRATRWEFWRKNYGGTQLPWKY